MTKKKEVKKKFDPAAFAKALHAICVKHGVSHLTGHRGYVIAHPELGLWDDTEHQFDISNRHASYRKVGNFTRVVKP